MPELPEVEHYRQILLSLVSKGSKQQQKKSVQLEFGPPPLPTKRFPSQQTIRLINEGNYNITNVLRKGKVLCVVLEKRTGTTTDMATITEDADITGNEATILLTFHMGMTGRLSTPNYIPKLESLSAEFSYPPPHTHLIINSPNGQQACFSDPRRFGSVFVHSFSYDGQSTVDEECIPTFQELAPDALTSSIQASNADIVSKLINQKKGIKAILLDQRQVISGVGNWVADEVLYRSTLHPDQSFLTVSEATKLLSEIQHVLSTAVKCLNDGEEFPEQWLFHCRWRGGGNSGTNSKDFYGKTICFVKSGGRSSAIVPSVQKKVARKVVAADIGATECKKKKKKNAIKTGTPAKKRKR